jgi:hypothetical protein
MVQTMGDRDSLLWPIFWTNASGGSTRCGRSTNAEEKIPDRQFCVRADLGGRDINARIVWSKVAADLKATV